MVNHTNQIESVENAQSYSSKWRANYFCGLFLFFNLISLTLSKLIEVYLLFPQSQADKMREKFLFLSSSLSLSLALYHSLFFSHLFSLPSYLPILWLTSSVNVLRLKMNVDLNFCTQRRKVNLIKKKNKTFFFCKACKKKCLAWVKRPRTPRKWTICKQQYLTWHHNESFEEEKMRIFFFFSKPQASSAKTWSVNI